MLSFFNFEVVVARLLSLETLRHAIATILYPHKQHARSLSLSLQKIIKSRNDNIIFLLLWKFCSACIYTNYSPFFLSSSSFNIIHFIVICYLCVCNFLYFMHQWTMSMFTHLILLMKRRPNGVCWKWNLRRNRRASCTRENIWIVNVCLVPHLWKIWR